MPRMRLRTIVFLDHKLWKNYRLVTTRYCGPPSRAAQPPFTGEPRCSAREPGVNLAKCQVNGCGRAAVPTFPWHRDRRVAPLPHRARRYRLTVLRRRVVRRLPSYRHGSVAFLIARIAQVKEAAHRPP